MVHPLLGEIKRLESPGNGKRNGRGEPKVSTQKKEKKKNKELKKLGFKDIPLLSPSSKTETPHAS